MHLALTQQDAGATIFLTSMEDLSPLSDLRLDYEKTIEMFKLLADIRFKLLAFVPTIVGAAIALIGDNKPAGVMIGVGALGLCGTIGVLLYELRNSELYNQAIHRAKYLEGLQKFPTSVAWVVNESHIWPENGGVFSERRRGGYDFLGSITVQHDIGLGFVYSAAVAGWVYLIARGMATATLASAQSGLRLALGFAAAAGLLTWTEVLLHDHYQFKPVRPGMPYEPPRKINWTRRRSLGFAAILIATSIALGMLAPEPVVSSAASVSTHNSVDGINAQGASSGEQQPSELAQVSGLLWSATGATVLIALAGVGMMIFGKDRKAAGGAVAAAGLTVASLLGGLHFKIDNLIKMEKGFELNPSLQAAINQSGARAPVKIGDIRAFASGHAEITGSMKRDFDEVCQAWEMHSKEGGLLMLVGSADRATLRSQTQVQYESNAGLARSRAEAVRIKIKGQCGVPVEQMLTTITGPAYTPEPGKGDLPSKGAADDRHVEVWAFWNAGSDSLQFNVGGKAEKKASKKPEIGPEW